MEMSRRTLLLAWVGGLTGALAGCGPSIDPALQADIDGRVAKLGAPRQTFGAPTTFAPRPVAVGQWTEHKLIDKDGHPGFMTYKVVGQEGDAFWIEMAQVQYTGRTVTKALVSLGDRMTPQSIVVKALKMKDRNGRVTDFDPQVIAMVRSLASSSMSMLVISWQGLPQQDASVPAGTFPGCYTVRTDAAWGPWSAASVSWSHPDVPLSGVVKSVGLDRPTSMELVAFGDAGATSELP